MNLRQVFIDNFAGDLEYHPRRAIVYFLLAIASFCFCLYSPPDRQFSIVPLVFVLGSFALVINGIFLMRRSSAGIGLSDQELARLSDPAHRKSLPSLPAQASQVVQDFGTGAFLLWPLLGAGKDIDKSWVDPPRISIFLTGAVLFLVGWAIRRLTTYKNAILASKWEM